MVPDEIIGCELTIIKSNNTSLVGTCGKVVDETKSLIVLETPNGLKKIIKTQCVFEINDKIIKGEHLDAKPEERVKKWLKQKKKK